jgi:L-threonylcarbamoyladenylate synthase
LPAFIGSAQKTVALRMPDHQELRDVARDFDGLFSTSANLAGQPLPETLADVSPLILAEIQLIVIDDEREVSEVSSTILDCTGAVPKIVREGAYERAELEQILGMKIG